MFKKWALVFAGFCAAAGAWAGAGQDKQKEKQYFVAGMAAFEAGAKACGWDAAKSRKAEALVAQAEKSMKERQPGSIMGYKEYAQAKAARVEQIREAMKDGKIRSQICSVAEEAL